SSTCFARLVVRVVPRGSGYCCTNWFRSVRLGHDSTIARPAECRSVNPLRPNNSFKPNLLRYTNNMAGKACHVVGSATQVGLTQALARMPNIVIGGLDQEMQERLPADLSSQFRPLFKDIFWLGMKWREYATLFGDESNFELLHRTA